MKYKVDFNEVTVKVTYNKDINNNIKSDTLHTLWGITFFAFTYISIILFFIIL